MDAKQPEPLLQALIKLEKKNAARQKAIETLLIGKGIVTALEWKKALNASEPSAGPHTPDIKAAVAYLETLAKQ